MKRIAVLTSGGDAPGMNAAIRAVVRAASYYKMEVYGIFQGYEGMVNGDFQVLKADSVSNIIHRGGTILKTSRSARFMTKAGMLAAKKNLEKYKIEGVVAIGGDGTFKGALEFSSLSHIPFIGIPGTIDNDLFGTDFCIGYDTAINTVVQAVDKIRDTADSHNRLFFVEVMGRDAGLIALRSGIGVGAEAVLIPETKTSINQLVEILERGRKRKKSSSIILVAEGDEEGGAVEVARKVKEKFDHYDTRISILGHMQRGGSPSCADRVLASRLGLSAVQGLRKGKKSVMAGIVNGDCVYVPFSKATKHITKVKKNLLDLVTILSV